jgi:Domain of unknown function (DUF4926)
MNVFREHSRVRVKQLLSNNRSFTGSVETKRPPRVGDVGRIVHIYDSGKAYVVEMTDSKGLAVWIADFVPQELEQVEPTKLGGTIDRM